MFIERILPDARERLVVVGDDAPLIDAARPLGNGATPLVVVCSAEGTMTGVASKTDVVQQIARCHGSACTMPVGSVMTRDVAACRPDDLLDDVWSVMKDRGLKRMPIVDRENRPLGLIDARDVLQGLLGEVRHEESLLRDYVMGVGYR